jgi:hypothetical protein
MLVVTGYRYIAVYDRISDHFDVLGMQNLAGEYL